MPLDFTMILGTSPPATSFIPFDTMPSLPFDDHHHHHHHVTGQPPYACRRVATFPMVNCSSSSSRQRAESCPSNHNNHFHNSNNNNTTNSSNSLKYRSLSESANLHRSSNNNNGIAIFELKRQLRVCVVEEQEEQQQPPREKGSSSVEADTTNAAAGKENGAEQEGPSSPKKETTKDDDDNQQKNDQQRVVDDDDDEAEKAQMKAAMMTRRRKKVAFADDRGFDLVMVRVMTESSDVPPMIDRSVIRALFGDRWAEYDQTKPDATWVVNFKQPASDYIAFREKLDSSFVSVENVLAKNDRCHLVGTVKVKNVSFEKRVFVRLTENDWKSYLDHQCAYSARGGGGGDAYDTFKFDFEIPRDDEAANRQRIEFCVCYKASEQGQQQEYWDSNGGKNYEIISERLRAERSKMQSQSTPNGGGGGANGGDGGQNGGAGNGCYKKLEVDAFSLTRSNWTEFASWSDLSTQGPYW